VLKYAGNGPRCGANRTEVLTTEPAKEAQMADENVTAFPALTAKLIEAARPAAKEYELADAGAPGLRLRVTAKGSRVFRWYVTRGGCQRVVTIGRWTKNPQPGRVTLAEARSWLERLKLAHKAGNFDSVLAELAASRPQRPPAGGRQLGGPLTVRELAKDFLVYIERRRKRPEQARRPIEEDIIPAIGDKALGSITSRDVRQIVESVVARGSPTQAGVVLAVMKQLFRFAQGRDELAANPAAALDPGALGVVRNQCGRYLSAEEIGQFWAGLDALSVTPTVRLGLKLLLLLGVRTGELLRARWDEIDFNAATWTIPVAHQKLSRKQEPTARPWVVPLTPMALELFRELEGLAKGFRSRYVMASLHAGGEALTEKALNHAMRRLLVGPDAPLHFVGERPTPHDLRRTMRTHLSNLGVNFHVAERCLNHSLGKVASIYDHSDYLTERRAALEKWNAYVNRLVSPAENSVAFLQAAKR
jgi:integrase